ncbi:MAG: tetratricopeptide repeat protein [Planctomycetes bacterium]|nr:tetratricopeptide repeat protein [Planctomycetota bacterium]
MTADQTINSGQATGRGRRGGMLCALAVCLAGTAAYWNSFGGAFVFDDAHSITESREMTGSVWEPLRRYDVRPVAFLTFWVNRRLGGLDVWDYHLVNLCVHLLAGLTLMGLVRRLLLSPRLARHFGDAAEPLAAAVAVVWAVHPIQTEAVTYIIQRCESLMGLFALLSIYLAVRGMESPRPAGWFAASLAAFLAGGGCKEAIITVPPILLAADMVFYSSVRAGGFWKAFRASLRRGWVLYAGVGLLAVLAVPVAYKRFTGGLKEGHISSPIVGAVFGEAGPSVWAYMITQPQVITHYLSLAFWPDSLCIDYCWPAARSIGEVWPGVAVVGVLIAATAAALWRWPAWGFVGLWFFLWLAPRSSVIIRPDLAVEHRMYLPLAAVVAVVIAAAYLAGRRLIGRAAPKTAVAAGCAALAVCVIALAVRTAHRNTDYACEMSIWQATVQNRWGSANPRAYYNLGVAWQDIYKQTRQAEALKRSASALTKACELSPGFDLAWFRLGFAYDELSAVGPNKMALLDKAILNYEKAVELVRNDAKYQKKLVKYLNNLGEAWRHVASLNSAAGQTEQAATAMAKASDCFRECMSLDPADPAGWYNMGCLMMQDGRPDKAIEFFRQAVAIKPDQPQVYANLGSALARTGRLQEALANFRKALELNPNDQEAQRGYKRVNEEIRRSPWPSTSPSSGRNFPENQ